MKLCQGFTDSRVQSLHILIWSSTFLRTLVLVIIRRRGDPEVFTITTLTGTGHLCCVTILTEAINHVDGISPFLTSQYFVDPWYLVAVAGYRESGNNNNIIIYRTFRVTCRGIRITKHRYNISMELLVWWYIGIRYASGCLNFCRFPCPSPSNSILHGIVTTVVMNK